MNYEAASALTGLETDRSEAVRPSASAGVPQAGVAAGSSSPLSAGRILLAGAREAYLDEPRAAVTIPVDRRCSGCGVDRDGCDHPFCSRYLSEGEE